MSNQKNRLNYLNSLEEVFIDIKDYLIQAKKKGKLKVKLPASMKQKLKELK
jgi:hypothetical protein